MAGNGKCSAGSEKTCHNNLPLSPFRSGFGLDLVDDATGRCALRFEPQETIWGAGGGFGLEVHLQRTEAEALPHLLQKVPHGLDRLAPLQEGERIPHQDGPVAGGRLRRSP